MAPNACKPPSIAQDHGSYKKEPVSLFVIPALCSGPPPAVLPLLLATMTSNATPPDAELGLESNVTLEAAPSEDSRVEEKATVLKVEKVENVTLEKKVDNKFITTALRPIFKFRAPTKTKPKPKKKVSLWIKWTLWFNTYR